MSEAEKSKKKMSDQSKAIPGLYKYVDGASDDNPLNIEIAIEDTGRVIIFHDKHFTHNIVMFEYDLGERRLTFIMEGEERADFGMPLNPDIDKHMHNTHQILMVYLDDETGEATSGAYIPLLLLQS